MMTKNKYKKSEVEILLQRKKQESKALRKMLEKLNSKNIQQKKEK